jgi:hypothetical protein
MSNIQPSEKLRVELNNRAKKVLEDMLALATPLHILKGDMFLAEKGKVPASVIGMIYEKALNTYLANPSRFPAVLKGFEEELEKYFPFGGQKIFEAADFSNIANKYFQGN